MFSLGAAGVKKKRLLSLRSPDSRGALPHRFLSPPQKGGYRPLYPWWVVQTPVLRLLNKMSWPRPSMAGLCLSGHEPHNDGVALHANKGKDLLGRNPHQHSPLNRLFESCHKVSLSCPHITPQKISESVVEPACRLPVGRQGRQGRNFFLRCINVNDDDASLDLLFPRQPPLIDAQQ